MSMTPESEPYNIGKGNETLRQLEMNGKISPKNYPLDREEI